MKRQSRAHRSRAALIAAFALLLALATPGAGAPQSRGVARHLARAQELEQAGDRDGARAEYERVLERDPRDLTAHHRLALIAREQGDPDLALDHATRFLEVWRHLDRAPPGHRAAHAELVALVREVDPFAREAGELRRRYVSRLLEFAERQMDQGRWHSARAILLEALGTDPDHPDLQAGLDRIRREGGNELAVEDETGGVDPLAGTTEEWVEENDPLHEEWEKAWTFETDHYRIRTNAGYRVLMTVANAMEQMNVFYRRFHRFHEDGKGIPVAGVHIFRTYEEYKTIGNAPTDWAGGHWDGSKVVTFDHRQGGDGSLRDTLQTLFHEASHQFTSLAGGSAVPAWLNEGMASFFEGTKLLSNGRIEWNLLAPGRLYPLAEDLESDSPHTLEQVITGQVEDYRVYYPWGWGIVYYLYNAEDDDGRLLYRDRLAEYFQEYHTPNHLERFDQYFVSGGGVEGVRTLEDFEQRFRAYIRRLVAVDRGEIDTRGEDEVRGDRQVALGDWNQAVRIYERLLAKDPGNTDVLWKLAGALEQAGQLDRAAGTLREWLAASLAAGRVDPARRREAQRRIRKLDKLAQGLEGLRTRYHLDSIALAERYVERGFARRALRLLRGPATALPPSEEARRRYFEIADASGVQLEQWRLLFDEESLAGFYGSGQENFRVQDGVILAEVDPDPGARGGGQGGPRTGVSGQGGDVFAFRRLFIDHEPAGDWSLSAEVSLSKGCRMAGLCFGKKGDGLFHGVVLLPEGYADLSVFETNGRTLKRVRVDLSPGWNRLRIDVAGTQLVARLGDEIVFEHEFETRAPLQGDFGLLAGAGRSSYREIRLLEFDPNLPRRAALGGRRRSAPAEGDLAGGFPVPERADPGRSTYLGEPPPPLADLEWIGDPPGGATSTVCSAGPCCSCSGRPTRSAPCHSCPASRGCARPSTGTRFRCFSCPTSRGGRWRRTSPSTPSPGLSAATRPTRSSTPTPSANSACRGCS